MRISLLARIGLVLTVTSAACAPTRGRSIVIRNVGVVDAARGGVDSNRTVVVQDGRIARIGGPEVRLGTQDVIVEGEGKFLIPGLWDSHVHFMNTGRGALALYIANGVTSVREMGGFLDSTRAWQREMSAGAITGPRIVTPGWMLENPRYLANVRVRDSAFNGRLVERILPYRRGVSDSATAQAVMDSLKLLGVDFVKFRTVGSADALRGIIGAAHRAGLRVAGHEPGVVSLAQACEMGQDDLEHGFALPADSIRHRLLACPRSRSVWYTPTLTVSNAVMLSGDSANALIFGSAARSQPARQYASDWLLGWWRMQVDERMSQPEAQRQLFRTGYRAVMPFMREMKTAGFRFLAGTDAGSVLVYPGFALHDELELLVRDAGFSPAEALYAATVEPSAFSKLDREVGRIATGQAADLVLLDANPLTDIRNTRRIAGVIVRGKFLDRQALDSLLASVRR